MLGKAVQDWGCVGRAVGGRHSTWGACPGSGDGASADETGRVPEELGAAVAVRGLACCEGGRSARDSLCHASWPLVITPDHP